MMQDKNSRPSLLGRFFYNQSWFLFETKFVFFNFTSSTKTHFVKHFFSTLLLLSFFSCNPKKQNDTTNLTPVDSIINSTPTSIPGEVDSDSALVQLSNKILSIIKNKDYTTLVIYFHPVEGTRFSPYGFIDTTLDVKFSSKNFIENIGTQKKMYWGNYDGSGDSIILTIEKYFERFVYNADFLNAEKTSVNKILGTGNSLNNLQAIYKDALFTESHFSGFDKKYGGMDWSSLRLVYKKYNNSLFLIAIVHDQWTI